MLNKWAKLATAEENPDKVGKFKCKHIRGEQKALKSWKRLFKKDFLTKALTGHWYTYHIYTLRRGAKLSRETDLKRQNGLENYGRFIAGPGLACPDNPDGLTNSPEKANIYLLQEKSIRIYWKFIQHLFLPISTQ